MIFHVTYHHGDILKITFSMIRFLFTAVSLTGDRAQGDDSKHDSHYTPDFSYEWIHFLVIVINIDLIFYLLNTALYNHIYSSIFVHMEDIFSPKTILKPNTSLFESLPLFSSEIFFFFFLSKGLLHL